jgi:hypothetical protein
MLGVLENVGALAPFDVNTCPEVPVLESADTPVPAPMITAFEVRDCERVAADPVVFWLSVGKFAAIAAATAVPLPYRMPVTVVSMVMAGVVVAFATVPANPFVDTTETEVTVPLVELHAAPESIKFPFESISTQ